MAPADLSSSESIDSLDHLRPLNARSLALSVMLGMHPPQLSAAHLIRLAGIFEIAPGTMRTALSRLARDGDVESDDGRYRIVGALLERQRAQDVGRTPPRLWTGEWHTVVSAQTTRSLASRRSFRATMINHRLGELRPGIWMRPANLPAPPSESGVVETTGSVSGPSGEELAACLWDLPAFARVAKRLLARCETQLDELDWDSADSVVPSFQLAATILRFLRREPLLPIELQPAGWVADQLRDRYRTLEQKHQQSIRRFLDTEQQSMPPPA